jgi:hypothetical protein
MAAVRTFEMGRTVSFNILQYLKVLKYENLLKYCGVFHHAVTVEAIETSKGT